MWPIVRSYTHAFVEADCHAPKGKSIKQNTTACQSLDKMRMSEVKDDEDLLVVYTSSLNP